MLAPGPALFAATFAAAVFFQGPAAAPNGPPANAVSDAASINASLDGLDDPTAAAYVGYALNHQLFPCGGTWPNGIMPTVQMADKFYSGCWLLKDPSLTPRDVAYVLAQLPNWTGGARR